MHVVKHKDDRWRVGWIDSYGRPDGGVDYEFVEVFSSRKQEPAFVVCSWLNGGPPPSKSFLSGMGISS